MYRIEFLPVAKEDIDYIIYYISYHLKMYQLQRNCDIYS